MIPNNFFIEAGNRICSSLEMDKALRSFYDYICQYIPVSHIAFALGDQNQTDLIHIVARTSATESFLNNYANINNYLHSNIDVEYDLVTFIDELSGKNTTDDPHFQLSAPLFGLSMKTEDRKRGGVLFLLEKGTKYNEEYATMIKGLYTPILIAFSNCLHYLDSHRLSEQLTKENLDLQKKLDLLSSRSLLGVSKPIKDVLSQIQSVAPLSTSVLVRGESGTGKEIAARMLHSLSNRADKAFVAVNCPAIPENLIESELFGYEKGSFTGSSKSHKGKFERADGGTIFLDEVADLSFSSQVKLLRVIQEMEIERIGGDKAIPVNVRIIAATNQDLEKMVAEKQFREDLYYRLSVFIIKMPPLRERPEDIPYLAKHFIQTKAAELKLPRTPLMSSTSLDFLMKQPWHGNVRELENFIERQLILSNINNSPTLEIIDQEQNGSQELITKNAEEILTEYLSKLLAQTQGKISGKNSVSSISGLSRDTIYRYKRKYNL